MVYIFGGDYSLTIIVPIIMMLAMGVFFLTVYIRDNIGSIKLFRKHKEKKDKKPLINFRQEYAHLKREIKHIGTSDALDEISLMIKKYVSEKLDIKREFSFEELPRNRLSWPIIEFTKRLSDLKYSGREVTRPEISHLLLYLSKILKVSPDAKEEHHTRKEGFISRFIQLPHIEIKLPKHHKTSHDIHHEVSKPLSIGLPKHITIDLEGLFRRHAKKIEKYESLGKKQKIELLIGKAKNYVKNTGKALKYYNKALKLNKKLNHSEFSSKLKSLHNEITRNEQEISKSTRIERERKIKSRQEKELNRSKEKLVDLMGLVQKNIHNYKKSLRLYMKSARLYNSLEDKSGFKLKLKSLYREILDARQKKIEIENKRKIDAVKKAKEEQERKIRLTNDLKSKSAEAKILRLIKKAENSISRKNRALRYYNKAFSLNSRENIQRKFSKELEILHKKIIEFKPKAISIKEVPVPKKKIRHHHVRRNSFFENLRMRSQSRKIMKLIRKAERKSFSNPLLSNKMHDEALMMYYKLPIDREENIAIKLNRFYEKINGVHERKLLDIKHSGMKSTKDAFKHMSKYRNYVVIEQDRIKNNLRNSVNELRNHAIRHMNKTRHKHVKSKISKFLGELSKEEDKIFSLEEKSINNLLNKFVSLFRVISKLEAQESYDLERSARKLFSHFNRGNKIPHAPHPSFTEIKREIDKVSILEMKPVEIQKEIILEKPVIVMPPEIMEVKKKISINPPRLPEKKISERMKKLMEEKEQIYKKLKETEEKELDRFKHIRRMTPHKDMGYHDFINKAKPRSELPEEHKIKKLFEAK